MAAVPPRPGPTAPLTAACGPLPCRSVRHLPIRPTIPVSQSTENCPGSGETPACPSWGLDIQQCHSSAGGLKCMKEAVSHLPERPDNRPPPTTRTQQVARPSGYFLASWETWLLSYVCNSGDPCFSRRKRGARWDVLRPFLGGWVVHSLLGRKAVLRVFFGGGGVGVATAAQLKAWPPALRSAYPLPPPHQS